MRYEDGTCSRQIIGAAIAVHKRLGPGLLESAYEACLAYELRVTGIRVSTQLSLPIRYRGIRIDAGYRLDLVVENEVIVELKTVKRLLPIHDAQMLSYLRLSGCRVGLLINFHVPRLMDGVRRLLNSH